MGDLLVRLEEYRSLAGLARSGRSLPHAERQAQEVAEACLKRRSSQGGLRRGPDEEAGEAGAGVVPPSDSFCAHLLRTLGGVGRSEEEEGEGQGVADGDQPQSPRGGIRGRGARKRRPSTLAAEAGLEIGGIGVASSQEAEGGDEGKGTESRPVVSTAATAIRRTPRGVPLVLSDCSALEDGYVGVFTGGRGSGEALVEGHELPRFLAAEERKGRQDALARGALRRAERTLASMEKERGEWQSQVMAL